MRHLLLLAFAAAVLSAGTPLFAARKTTIFYYGQSCFSISGAFPGIIFDPFGKTVKYVLPRDRFGIVLISHEHDDHNNVADLTGFPIILRGLKSGGKEAEASEFTLGGFQVKGLPSFHDDQRGAIRGLNTIFVLDLGGFRVAHLGDLGCPLTPEQEKELRNLDLLFVPVGGFYTIGPEQAAEIVKKLKPRIAIPMHYKTEVTEQLPIQPVDAFLKYFPEAVRVKGPGLALDLDKPIEKPGVYVLEIKK